jgi:hypothetical protein
MIRVVHPGSRILFFYPSRIPDPGVKKAPYPGSATLLFISSMTIFHRLVEPKMADRMAAKLFPFYFLKVRYFSKYILLQDDLLRLESYKADLSHLNLSLSNLIAQLVGPNSSSAPLLLITQNNSSGRGKILSCTVTVTLSVPDPYLNIWIRPF